MRRGNSAVKGVECALEHMLILLVIFRKGVADEQLAKFEQERGRKRDRMSEDPEIRGASKRIRSASSASVSTISTGMSRSPSSPPRQHVGDVDTRKAAPPSPRQRPTDFEKKRRRDSMSSVDSYSSAEDRRDYRRDSRERASSRSTRSPQRGGRRMLSNDRHTNAMEEPRHANRSPVRDQRQNRPPPRERSLSPFSKRLALTQSMNMDR
jgi:hypothetical protein